MTNTEVPAIHNLSCEIAIVGAGPVGLLLGNLLGAKGFRVILIEKRATPTRYSQAIGITPPSLGILSKLGLDQDFIASGVKITECFVHGNKRLLGRVSFAKLPEPYPFILSLPQAQNVAILESRLTQYPHVTLLRGAEVNGLEQSAHSISLIMNGMEAATSIEANYVIACDGSRSRVRDEFLKLRTTRKTYGCHFVMGDFTDRSGLGSAAHLFFTSDGAVESFPLPDGRRRWIVQTETHLEDAPRGLIVELVNRRSGHELGVEDQLNQNAFTPNRIDCDQYYDSRVVLCGDAAHVMSPIGGQGMNTGFADAAFLADALEAILRKGQAPESLLVEYNRSRQKAARTSANRAALGMWLGTWKGRHSSFLREQILRYLILRGPVSRGLASSFAMLKR